MVGGVHEGDELALLDDDCELLPLLNGWVHAGGVVRASVQQQNGAGGGLVKTPLHSLEVQALGLCVEVRVLGELQSAVLDDVVVVRPIIILFMYPKYTRWGLRPVPLRAGTS